MLREITGDPRIPEHVRDGRVWELAEPGRFRMCFVTVKNGAELVIPHMWGHNPALWRTPARTCFRRMLKYFDCERFSVPNPSPLGRVFKKWLGV